MSGVLRAQAVIEACDALAAWEPESFADVFHTLAELPDVLGAVAEAVAVVAVAAEEARAVREEIITAAEEAAAWTATAAGGLGTEYSRWTMLRRNGTRWLPRDRSPS